MFINLTIVRRIGKKKLRVWLSEQNLNESFNIETLRMFCAYGFAEQGRGGRGIETDVLRIALSLLILFLWVGVYLIYFTQ